MSGANLSLYLEGEAYVVQGELSADRKKDPTEVKSALRSAFRCTAAQSFQMFRARTLHVDESMEGYAADLKKSVGECWADRSIGWAK